MSKLPECGGGSQRSPGIHALTHEQAGRNDLPPTKGMWQNDGFHFQNQTIKDYDFCLA